MISDVLGALADPGPYPMLALIIFLAAFIGVVIWAVTANRSYIARMERLPLEDNMPIENEGGQKNDKV